MIEDDVALRRQLREFNYAFCCNNQASMKGNDVAKLCTE